MINMLYGIGEISSVENQPQLQNKVYFPYAEDYFKCMTYSLTCCSSKCISLQVQYIPWDNCIEHNITNI